MQCARCGKQFKPWSVRGLTADGYGPTCARIMRLIPPAKRKAKQSRRRKPDLVQIELELT